MQVNAETDAVLLPTTHQSTSYFTPPPPLTPAIYLWNDIQRISPPPSCFVSESSPPKIK